MYGDTKTVDVLLALTRKMVTNLSLDDALHAVTDAALELLPCDHASVRILDETGTDLLSGARSGTGVDQRPMDFRRGEGVVGWVVEHGKSALVTDTADDSRFKKGGGFAIGSMLMVPLSSGDQVVGVLGVTSSRERAFSVEDETMATLLANCTVPAIDKARRERLAVTDRNTKAYERDYLFPRLREEVRRAKRYVVPLGYLQMHLDEFDAIIERHGVEAGDRVLRCFAERVRTAIRRSDVLVRRAPGAFVLIMPYTNSQQAFEVAEKIRGSVSEEGMDCRDDIVVEQTVSVGVAVWTGQEFAEEIDARAELAAIQARRKGGNRTEMASIKLEPDQET
jgi:diguanylate cyclase (GGDEF)-like protein